MTTIGTIVLCNGTGKLKLTENGIGLYPDCCGPCGSCRYATPTATVTVSGGAAECTGAAQTYSLATIGGHPDCAWGEIKGDYHFQLWYLGGTDQYRIDITFLSLPERLVFRSTFANGPSGIECVNGAIVGTGLSVAGVGNCVGQTATVTFS